MRSITLYPTCPWTSWLQQQVLSAVCFVPAEHSSQASGIMTNLSRRVLPFRDRRSSVLQMNAEFVHQVWAWTGPDTYDVHQYISLERDKHWDVLHFSSRYRCLLRAELTQALLSAGFVDVEWLMPSTTGYYQPIVFGRVP